MNHVTVAVSVLMESTCESAKWARIKTGNRPFTAGQGDIEHKFRKRDQSNGQL